jgi:aspartate aminotransferase
MHISKRVQEIAESVTLKLNAKAVAMSESGKQVFNLTAGQLPYRPLNEFVDLMRNELEFLKSFQYSPVAGYEDLRKMLLNHVEKTREVTLPSDFDCVISNGGKHSISNILGCIVDPDDEVIILAPYWISYPELIKFCKGKPVVVTSSIFDVFVPSLASLEQAITPKTRAIIINSPNNPSGTHYDEQWMRGFGELMKKHPEVTIICDEIYYQLSYYDPKPTYYYQFYPELLAQTVIVDGISKTLASTGLRIGYAIGPKELTKAMGKLQGQTTSGANSLVQRAMINFDFGLTEQYLIPIKLHLRENSETVREVLREASLSKIWYQSTSAFYFMIDFSQTKVMERFRSSAQDTKDYSDEICEELLENFGVAVVPGKDFGMPNSARISLVLPKDQFREAMTKLVKFLG